MYPDEIFFHFVAYCTASECRVVIVINICFGLATHTYFNKYFYYYYYHHYYNALGGR